MPKIKVSVNRLKWIFAWVITTIKAFLMQNLRLKALLVFEIWRHKFSYGRRERVIKFGYLPPESGFTFKKKWIFMSRIVLLDPKIDPPPNVNFSNFQAEKNFSFSNFLERLDEKRATATPWLFNFAKIWSERVLRTKTKGHQVWISDWQLWVWSSGPLRPPSRAW